MASNGRFVQSRNEYLKEMLANKESRISNNFAPLNTEETPIDSSSLEQSATLTSNLDYLNRVAQTETKKKEEGANWWTRFTDTVQSLGTTITDGILNAFDSLWDFGVDVADAIAGGNNAWADDLTSYDWQAQVNQALNITADLVSGEMFNEDYWSAENWSDTGARENLNQIRDNSYIDDESFVGNLLYSGLESAGYMLPSIVAGIATGGTSTLAQGVSLGVMGVQAFADQTHDVLEETNDWGKALFQGAASAAVEVGTELFVGKALKAIGIGTGKIAGVVGNTAKKGTSSAVKEIAKTMFEEGAEEVVSAVLDPVVQSISKGKDAFYDEDGNNVYTTSKFWIADNDSVLNQFLIGGLTAGVMGGGQIISNFNRYSKDGMNKVINPTIELQETLQEIRDKGETTERLNKASELTDTINQGVQDIVNSGNQKVIDNINEFMTNPIGQMINIINENQVTISQYLAQNNVQSLAKALKLTNLDTLKVNFSSDINENASYNPITNEITLNTRNEGNYIPVIAHELVGHAILGEVIQSDNGNAIYENIAKNILSEQELANIRNNYTELNESGFKEEVVSFGLEKIMNNTNNLSYKKFVRKFFPSSFKDNVMNALETVFRNNSDTRVINETRKLINQVFNQNISNAVNQDLAVRYEKNVENLDENDNNYLYERTNEFRRLQEESRNLSNKDIQSFHSGSQRIDDSFRRLLETTFKRQINTTRNSLWHGDRSLVNQKNNNSFTIVENVDGNLFHDIFEIVNKYLPNGDAVDVHEAFDYSKNQNFLSDDGLSGFSITPSGDLISVFSLSKNRGFLYAIRDYIKEKGAKTLDCFNSIKQPLAEIYAKTLGFKTASTMDFNYDVLAEEHGKEYADYFVKTYGEAPVSFMVDASQNVETKYFNKDQYDEALQYQLSFVKNNSKKYSKSNVLELSKNEVKDLANRKEGEVITYKSATDFINSFNSIGEVLEDRFNIKLNRSDTAITDLFNDTNIQNSEVAVDNLFKNTLVEYNDTQISLDTYLNNLGFKTNDLKNYLIEALKDKTKLSKESEFVNKLVNELNNAHNKILENRQHLKNYKKITSKVKNLVELIDKNKKPSAYGDINTDEISALRNFVSGRYSLVDGGLSGTLRKKAYELNSNGYLNKIENSIFNDAETYAKADERPLYNALSYFKELALSYEQDVNRQKPLTLEEEAGFLNAIGDIYTTINDYQKGVYSEVENKVKDINLVEKYHIENATRKGFLSKARRFISKLINPMDYFSTIFGGRDSLGFKELVRPMIKDYSSMRLDQVNLAKGFEDKITFKKSDIYNKGNYKADFNGKSLRRYHLYSLYLNLSTPANLEKIKASKEVQYLNSSNNQTGNIAYSDTLLDDVKKALTTKEINELNTLKDYYNNEVRDYLKKAQEKIVGFSNLVDDYYPIVSSYIQKNSNVATANAQKYGFMVDASSWGNLKVRTNSTQKILLVDPLSAFYNYLESASRYNNFTQDQKMINRILNKKISGQDSLRSIISSKYGEYPKMLEYFFDMVNGMPAVQGAENLSLIGKLGGSYATAVLSFNLGTPLKQLGSLPTASLLTGFRNSIKSLGKVQTYNLVKSYKYLVEHNGVFAYRMYNNGAKVADTLIDLSSKQGILSTPQKLIQKLSEIGLTPMEAVDTGVVLLSFAQAQEYVAQTQNLEVGTEENMAKASEMMNDIILFTQSNADPLAMSMLRSGKMGDLARYVFGVFGSDSQNKLSLLYETIANSISNRQVLNKINAELNKSTLSETDRKLLETEKNRITKEYSTKNIFSKVSLNLGTLATSALIATLVTLFIRKLLGKEDWDDNDLNQLTLDFLSETFIDWAPIAGTIKNWIQYNDGEAQIMSFQALSGILSSITTLMSGDFDGVKWLELFKSFSQVMGIPLENLINLFLGTINTFSPELALEYRSFLYQWSPEYLATQYKEAREDGRKADALKRLTILLERAKSQYNASNTLLNEFYNLGYYPKDVGIDNFNVALYSKATSTANKVVTSTLYRTLEDNQKATVLKRIYNSYYDASLEEQTSKFGVLVKGGMDIYKIGVAYQILNDIEATETKTRKELIETRLSRMQLDYYQKLLLKVLLGYAITDNQKNNLANYLRRYLKQTEIEKIL